MAASSGTAPHRLTALARAGLVVYSMGIEALVWGVLVPLTCARILLGRADWDELRERLGRDPVPVPGGLLIHAVSVGEMRAVSALIARHWTSRPIALTTGTRGGREVAASLARSCPNVRSVSYLPWDRPAVGAWVRARNVQAVVVAETELWPNLFAACAALEVPVFLVNGRMEAAALRRYGLARWFFKPLLERVRWIGTEDESGREAFLSLGGSPSRVEVVGTLKADAPGGTRVIPESAGHELRRRPLLVAGSTHSPEEQWLVEALGPALTASTVRLVVAPRDVRRSRAIQRIAERHGHPSALWSDVVRRDAPGTHPWEVLVVDELGWLPALYATSSLVLLGGTLAPVGGHNIFEAAWSGRPIVVGPHVESIGTVVARMRAAGALIEVREASVPSLRAACMDVLDRPDEARAIGRAARASCEVFRGAAERYGRAIDERLG